MDKSPVAGLGTSLSDWSAAQMYEQNFSYLRTAPNHRASATIQFRQKVAPASPPKVKNGAFLEDRKNVNTWAHVNGRINQHAMHIREFGKDAQRKLKKNDTNSIFGLIAGHCNIENFLDFFRNTEFADMDPVFFRRWKSSNTRLQELYILVLKSDKTDITEC